MDISVIIPNLNSPIIDKVVRCILDQKTSKSFDVTTVGLDKYKLIPEDPRINNINTQNPTPQAISRNTGAFRTSGKLIVFLDADCLADESLLEAHWDAHVKNSNSLICGSVTFPKKGYLSLCDNVATFHAYLPHLPEGKRRVLPTLNFSILRENWQKLGGFDPALPIGEDAELVQRALGLGMNAFFSPVPKVEHDHNRLNISSILQHAWRFGQYSLLLNNFNEGIGLWIKKIVFSVGAPLIALGIIFKIVIKSKLPARYWHTLPVVYMAKVTWCLGYAIGK